MTAPESIPKQHDTLEVKILAPMQQDLIAPNPTCAGLPGGCVSWRLLFLSREKKWQVVKTPLV